MKNPLVVYFEGLPGSGKTTLISHLVNNHPGLFDMVPEYPDPDAAGAASDVAEQSYFTANDERKHRLARAARSAGRTCLVDRGHLSTVLYSKAYEAVRGAPLIDVDAWYIGTILTHNMLPDAYVYIDSTPEVTFARRPKSDWDNIWDDEAALRYAISGFDEYVSVHEAHVPILRLDGRMTTEEMGETVVGYVSALGQEARDNLTG